jgi:hypothetical protein
MRLTAKPVAAAHASKITGTANPLVAVLWARAITKREEEYAIIAAPWAASRCRYSWMEDMNDIIYIRAKTWTRGSAGGRSCLAKMTSARKKNKW